MPTRVGEIAALFRYPVKSMAGESVEAADLGWHGLDGDRRLALRRLDDRSGFPWLTASKVPDLLRFVPLRRGALAAHDPPSHVRTPEGEELPAFGPELAADLGRRHGSPVEMAFLNRGIFDEAAVSVVAAATVESVCGLAGLRPDVRRFRPNLLLATTRSAPFEEDAWVGGLLTFGDAEDAPAIYVTNRDERCSMVNLDPDTALPDPNLLKAVVKARDNKAGVYGAVARRGRLAVGQPVYFRPTSGDGFRG